MEPSRRDLLRALGIGSASTLLWACGTSATARRGTPLQQSGEVRGWLREAVSRLAPVYPGVHALAVSRRRTTAAIDVLGTGVARGRHDAVVLTVRDRDGWLREHVSADLSADGVREAVRSLGGGSTRAAVAFPAEPPSPAALPAIDDAYLHNLVAALARKDRATSSRIVYAATLIDVDDVTVWSIAPDHDREHRVRRVRQRATRAAWTGTRPVVREIERGWSGALEDRQRELSVADITGASTRALQLMTPGTVPEGEATVVLEPSIVAALVDVAVGALLTERAARRPEVGQRLAIGATVGAPALTLVDDPTAAGAYGALAFDDAGLVARPVALLDGGKIAGRIDRLQRAGHVGEVGPSPSHLVLRSGTTSARDLAVEGWLLEGVVDATVDPSSGRVVIGVAQARELAHGAATGRVYADVELVGELGAMLGAVTGLGATSETFSLRDEVAGEPRWRSMTVPAVRTRALLRARRRPA